MMEIKRLEFLKSALKAMPFQKEIDGKTYIDLDTSLSMIDSIIKKLVGVTKKGEA